MELRNEVNIPHTLRDIGIDDTRAAEIGEMAVADSSAGTNPIQFDAAAYTAILVNAINGNL